MASRRQELKKYHSKMYHIDRFSKKQKVTCIRGYLRSCCDESQIVKNLEQSFILMLLIDAWNEKVFTKGLSVGESSVAVSHKYGQHWLTVFGSHIVNRRQIKRWTIRQFNTTPTSSSYKNDAIIGIIEAIHFFNLSDPLLAPCQQGVGAKHSP